MQHNYQQFKDELKASNYKKTGGFKELLTKHTSNILNDLKTTSNKLVASQLGLTTNERPWVFYMLSVFNNKDLEIDNLRKHLSISNETILLHNQKQVLMQAQQEILASRELLVVEQQVDLQLKKDEFGLRLEQHKRDEAQLKIDITNFRDQVREHKDALARHHKIEDKHQMILREVTIVYGRVEHNSIEQDHLGKAKIELELLVGV